MSPLWLITPSIHGIWLVPPRGGSTGVQPPGYKAKAWMGVCGIRTVHTYLGGSLPGQKVVTSNRDVENNKCTDMCWGHSCWFCCLQFNHLTSPARPVSECQQMKTPPFRPTVRIEPWGVSIRWRGLHRLAFFIEVQCFGTREAQCVYVLNWFVIIYALSFTVLLPKKELHLYYHKWNVMHLFLCIVTFFVFFLQKQFCLAEQSRRAGSDHPQHFCSDCVSGCRPQ